MLTRHATLAADPGTVFDPLAAVAVSNGCQIERGEERMEIVAPLGTVTLQRRTNLIDIALSAASPAELQLFIDIYARRFDSLGFGEALNWEAVQRSAPLNQILCTLTTKEQISPNFMRLRLTGDFSPFLVPGAGLHFRLLFGPEDGVWPTVDARGLTQWPGGPSAWHRPPYTVRQIAEDATWIDVDVVLHDGGRVTNWCRDATLGTEVALHGPSGSKQPQANWLALFGDETALPVIVHMLERAQSDTRGEAMICVRHDDDVQEIEAPAGVTVSWVTDGRSDALHDAIAALKQPDEDRYVFFAGEASDAKRIRSAFKELGLTSTQSKAAGYWTRKG